MSIPWSRDYHQAHQIPTQILPSIFLAKSYVKYAQQNSSTVANIYHMLGKQELKSIVNIRALHYVC